MYNPAVQSLLIHAHVEDLRRAQHALALSRLATETDDSRPTATRLGFLTRAFDSRNQRAGGDAATHGHGRVASAT